MLSLVLVATLSAAPPMVPVEDFTTENIQRTTEQFVDQVAHGVRRVYFHIDSLGGSVFGGMKLIKLVNRARRAGIHTTCLVDGAAMSMAFVFLQAACDDRWMTEGSILLAHKGSVGAAGTVEQVQEAASLLRAINKAMASVCASRMGMSVAEFETRVAVHAWVLAWDEALTENAVDNVVSPLSPSLPM